MHGMHAATSTFENLNQVLLRKCGKVESKILGVPVLTNLTMFGLFKMFIQIANVKNNF